MMFHERIYRRHDTVTWSCERSGDKPGSKGNELQSTLATTQS